MTADVPVTSAEAPGDFPEAPVRPSRLVLPSYGRPRGVHPPLDFSGYRSTALRHPKKPLVLLPQRLTEVTGPLLGEELITPTDGDLTMQHAGNRRASGSSCAAGCSTPAGGRCRTR